MPLRRFLVAYGAWIVVLAAIFATVRPLRTTVIVLAGLTATVAVVYGIRRYRPVRRWPWYCLAAALSLDTATHVISHVLPEPALVYQRGSPVLYGVFLVMSVFMIVGVIGLARSARRDLTAVVDVAILLLGTGLLVGVLIAVPFALTPDLPALQAAARVFFVARDVILLAATVHVATSERWNASLGLLVAGIAGFLTHDAVFSLGTVRGILVTDRSIELIWLFFAGTWGMAALLPAMRRLGEPGPPSERSVRLRLGLLAVAAVLPVTLLILATFQPARSWYEPLFATVSAIMLALVLAQLLGVAINLRNQVAGEQALRRAVAEVAAGSDVEDVTATLEATVPLLGTGRPSANVRVAADYESPAPPDVLVRAIAVVDPPPSAVAARLGDGPAVAYSLCQDDGRGLLSLYLRGDRSAVDRLWPRLDVLATQACLVLERIRLRGELVRRTTEEYVNAVAQTSGDVILLVDDSDRVTLASPSANAMFGTSDVIGARLPDLVEEETRPAVTGLLRRARTRESPLPDGARATLGRPQEAVAPPATVMLEPAEGVDTATWSLHRDDGTEIQLEVACRQVTSTEPSVRGLLVTIRDVTELRRLERDLTERASRDPLTGLVSGLVVRERVRQDIEEHPHSPISMIVLDIDDFKLINAQHGLDVGDAVLQAVAGRLTDALPPTSLAGRVAGDRFAVVVDIDRPSDADEIAGTLLAAVARPIEVDHTVVTCTATAGVATTADARTAQELARQAELAFLIARDTGRGHWHHYDPAARSTVIERLELRSALKQALEKQAFALVYQPIVDLQTGVVAGFEALLRWHHPTYGHLSPTAFIDVAEESRLIIPIGDWALKTAIRDARRWEAVAADEPPFIAVNVSSTQFESPDFFDGIQSKLAASGLPASRLHIEITESAVLNNDAVWSDLQRLRATGIQIAVDDFGTGYSALSYLGRVPIDRIKLDRQFVASMTANRTQRDLVEGIVQLTRILKLDVIAEGVETTQERDLAAEVGCRYGQGYLFARPMPVEATVAWMADKRDHIAALAVSGHTGHKHGPDD